jgi:hypothetical protein
MDGTLAPGGLMEPKARKDSASAQGADRKPAKYDAPAVERVMSAEDLAREIHYAGTQNPSLDPG